VVSKNKQSKVDLNMITEELCPKNFDISVKMLMQQIESLKAENQELKTLMADFPRHRKRQSSSITD